MNTDLNNTSSARLREIRKQKGLTQKELAEILEVTQGTITDIERGKVGVSKKNAEKLREKLKINPGWLFSGIGEKYIVNGKLVDIDTEITELPIDEEQKFNKDGSQNMAFVRKNLDLLRTVATKKIRYNEVFFEELANENAELYDMFNAIKRVTDFHFIIEDILESKIGVLLDSFGTLLNDPNLTTKLPSYKEYKNERIASLREVATAKELFSRLSKEIEIFQTGLQKIANQLDYEDSFTSN